MTAQQKLNARIAKIDTAQLIDICRQINLRTDAEAAIVLSAGLDALMARMDDERFLALCNELEVAA